MDTKTLIEKLNGAFCEDNRQKQRYSKIWLSEVDFGGLYDNDMFVLNVKADHEIGNCGDEIRNIILMLQNKAADELKKIWSVVVYNAQEEIHCWSDDLIVFDDSRKCEPSTK